MKPWLSLVTIRSNHFKPQWANLCKDSQIWQGIQDSLRLPNLGMCPSITTQFLNWFWTRLLPCRTNSLPITSHYVVFSDSPGTNEEHFNHGINSVYWMIFLHPRIPPYTNTSSIATNIFLSFHGLLSENPDTLKKRTAFSGSPQNWKWSWLFWHLLF